MAEADRGRYPGFSRFNPLARRPGSLALVLAVSCRSPRSTYPMNGYILALARSANPAVLNGAMLRATWR
jgi:hypothetical protein